MKLIAVERQIIQTNIESLSQIEWTSQNDEKLNELFFGISDIFEEKLKLNKKIRDWRKIEICFQHRALTDNENEYPKTKNVFITLIKDFLNQINIDGKL